MSDLGNMPRPDSTATCACCGSGHLPPEYADGKLLRNIACYIDRFHAGEPGTMGEDPRWKENPCEITVLCLKCCSGAAMHFLSKAHFDAWLVKK